MPLLTKYFENSTIKEISDDIERWLNELPLRYNRSHNKISIEN